MRLKHFASQKILKADIGLYEQFGKAKYRKLKKLGAQLAGRTIVHVNSANSGGGVAELLKSQVPLERSLGLDSRWLVLQAPERFFVITKKIHNLLQGQTGVLSDREKRTYLTHVNIFGQELSSYLENLGNMAAVVIHDPQPAPVVEYLPQNTAKILRIHIDLSGPNKVTLDFLKPYIKRYHKVILSNEKFRPYWLSRSRTTISYPSINPFTQKNKYLPEKKADQLLKRLGLDTKRPIISQVSRLDPWKDPFGVVEAYYLAKKKIPGLQLILEGIIIAKDDPEAKAVYHKLAKQCKGNSDILLLGRKGVLHKFNASLDILVNAIQRSSDIVIQKSIKEGFGMTVTEAMWKGKPVIGGNVGGIHLQIKNGYNGYLVNSPVETAERVVQILNNPKLAKKLGRNAHRTVRDKFLSHAMVLDFLQLYQELI